jgi:PAS domain S-box-containing protein
VVYKKKNGELFVSESVGTPVRDSQDKVKGFLSIVRDITIRKQAEMALKASEAFNKTIIKHSPLGISVRNRTGKLLSYNESWKKIWGKSDEMIHDDITRDRTGLKFTDADSYLGKWQNKVKKVYERGGSLYLPEASFVHEDNGKTVWISQYYYGIKNEKDEVERVVIITEDITERKQVETMMRTSHDLLSISYKHTEMKGLLNEILISIKDFVGCEAVGIRILGEHGQIPYQAYTGFSEDFYEFESPLSINNHRCMCINVIKGSVDDRLPFYTGGGSFYTNATTKLLADISKEEKGETRNVCNKFGYESVALVPIKASDKILGLIHCADSSENHINIESVRVLEQLGIQLGATIQRTIALEALAESEEKFRNLVESMNDGLLVVDTERRITYANEKMAAMLKTNRDNLLGRKTSNFMDENNKRILDKQWAFRKKGGSIPYELEWKPIDGSTVNTIVSPRPLMDKNGVFAGSYSVITDITERKKMETFNKMQSRLSDDLRETTDIKQCLKFGCQAIYDSHIFMHTVFFLGNDQDKITNLEYIGVGERELVLIKNAAPSKADELQAILQAIQTTGRIIVLDGKMRNELLSQSPQECIDYPDLNNAPRWKENRLLVPIDDNIMNLHGWFIADTPFEGAIIDNKVILFIESVVDAVVKRVNEVEFIRRLQQKHRLLEDKNITLREVLASIEKEKMDIRQHTANEIDKLILPLLNKLVNVDGSINQTYFQLLSNGLKDIVASPQSKAHIYSKLSPREVQICDLIKAGVSSKEIAEKLHLSTATIQKHRERIRNKLGLAGQNVNLMTYLSNPE